MNRRLRRILAAALAVALAVGFLGACGDDDDPRTALRSEDGGAAADGDSPAITHPSGLTLTTRAGLDADDPQCQELKVLVQPGIGDEQKAAIEAIIEGDDRVAEYRFEGEGGNPAFQVRPEDLDEAGDIGGQFAGVEGVVSVVYPRQICQEG